MDYIKRLRKAIWRLHGCDADHIETIPVTEIFEGKTVWQGDVEVFRLRGHPRASRCYAWAHKSGKQDKRERFVAVLELPPIMSPQSAVQAAIVAEYKEKNG